MSETIRTLAHDEQANDGEVFIRRSRERALLSGAPCPPKFHAMIWLNGAPMSVNPGGIPALARETEEEARADALRYLADPAVRASIETYKNEARQ